MRWLQGSVPRWVLIVAILAGVAVSQYTPASQWERTLERNGVTLVMSCERWSGLYLAASNYGIHRMTAFLSMPNSAATANDHAFFADDIIPELNRRNAPTSFNGVLGICAEGQL